VTFKIPNQTVKTNSLVSNYQLKLIDRSACLNNNPIQGLHI